MDTAKKNTPFWDNSLPIEKRLDWLLKEMTIEEKLGCLSGTMRDLDRLGIPAMGVGGEAAHGVEARNDQNDLGAPEATTSFVQPIGMSATWDPELIQKAGEVTGEEVRVLYHRHPDRGLSRWAPTVDLERDPRWGRTEEGYGEDPLLTGEMASAYIHGMQGEDPHYLRVAATLKHFYGNNTEEGRGWKSSSIDPRNKYELYLEPFRRAIQKGGAEAVMTAYNKINGVPGMLNPEVQEILKDQYGLGHVVSDGGAMALVETFHHTYGTHGETLVNALRAGVDSMSDNPELVEKAAWDAYERGILTEDDMDRAIRNMFRTKLRLGIYDAENRNPYDRVTEADLNSPKHQEIAKKVAREAIVLLKNEQDLLPLDPSIDPDSIAVIGPWADAWYQDWYGGEAYSHTTLRQGLKEILHTDPAVHDGQDRVTFFYGEKGLCAAQDGSICLGGEPDVFVMEDWGEGNYTFRCERTGMYLNTRFYVEPEQRGILAAEKVSAFDWFVMETFHVEELGDGKIRLTDRFRYPVRVRDDQKLASMDLPYEEAVESASVFTMKKVSDGVREAAAFAQNKKVVLLALGCNPMISAKEEVDRKTLALPDAQRRLMEAVTKANPNVVLVLFSNYPYAVRYAKENIPAILWSATGAQDLGEAMAQTIFGLSHPSGRLNLTWYTSENDLPDIDDYDIIKGKRTYRYFDREVLYPFGFGCTYTTFAYSDLALKLADPTTISVSFQVKNTGRMASDEVCQVYGRAPVSRVKKPLRQLLGFERVKDVKPGEIRQITIRIPVEEFRFYDVISQTLMVEEGEYTIWAGASSDQMEISGTIDLPGAKTSPRVVLEEKEAHPHAVFGRSRREKIRADHYDDYENIEIIQGDYRESAVTQRDAAKPGVLCYRDCISRRKITKAWFYVKSEQGGSITVRVDGKTVGSWQGNTADYIYERPVPTGPDAMAEEIERIKTWNPVYTAVPVEFEEKDTGNVNERFELELILEGDIRLSRFWMEG